MRIILGEKKDEKCSIVHSPFYTIISSTMESYIVVVVR